MNGRGEMVDFRRVRRPPRPPPPAAARGRAPGCAPAVAAGDEQQVAAGTILRVQQAPRLRSRLVAREQQFAALGDGAWRNESRGRVRPARGVWRRSHRAWWQQPRCRSSRRSRTAGGSHHADRSETSRRRLAFVDTCGGVPGHSRRCGHSVAESRQRVLIPSSRQQGVVSCQAAYQGRWCNAACGSRWWHTLLTFCPPGPLERE